MNASEGARILLEAGIPKPPPELVGIVRGKRDRVSPTTKAQAIVMALCWEEQEARILSERHDLAREDEVWPTRFERLALLTREYHAGASTDEAGRKLRGLSLDAEAKVDYINPELAEAAARRAWKRKWRPVLEANCLSAGLSSQDCADYMEEVFDRAWTWYSSGVPGASPSSFDEAWERFKEWAAAQPTGATSLAASIAGVSRTTAAKWLAQSRAQVEEFLDRESAVVHAEYRKTQEERKTYFEAISGLVGDARWTLRVRQRSK